MKKVCEDWKQALPAAGDYGPQYFDEFSMRAQAVAAEVFRVKTSAEARSVISELAKTANAKKVVLTENPYTKAAGLKELFQTLSIETHTGASAIREHCDTADLGISAVEFGIAETGSVCQDAYAIEDRLVSTLPPVHIALLSSNNVVPSVEAAVAIFSQVFERGYLSLITGPSRTADIERVLTIGVHGPSRLVIIAVDEEPEGGSSNGNQ